MITATSFKAKYVTVSQVFLQLIVAPQFDPCPENGNLCRNLFSPDPIADEIVRTET